MPYTPDATDPSQPTDNQKASSMGLEFRTLKAYIQSTLVPSIIDQMLKSSINLMAVGAQVRWPGGNGAEGILAADYSTFTFDTNKAIPQYGLSWKTLAGATLGASAFLSGKAGIYFCANGAVQMQLASTGNLIVAGNITANGGQFSGNAASSTITAQRTFSRVRTDGINRGTVGSISVSGATGGYAGIDFTDANGSFLATNLVQGYTYNDDTWRWQWSSGVLTVGSVPWARIPDRPTNLSQFTNDLGGSSGVASYNGRTGAVTPISADVTGALGYTPYNAVNPAGYITLANVSAAGYQTSAGSVNFATTAGNGVSSIVHNFVDSSGFVSVNTVYDVTATIVSGVLTLNIYRYVPSGGGGGGGEGP